MWLARTRFRRTTELGRRAAIRAAKLAERDTAALVIQKHARRRLAFKLVSDAAVMLRHTRHTENCLSLSLACLVAASLVHKITSRFQEVRWGSKNGSSGVLQRLLHRHVLCAVSSLLVLILRADVFLHSFKIWHGCKQQLCVPA